FQVNRKYSAKNLCFNRLRPSCCCRVKCYLNKKIADDESQQQAPGKGGQREETVLQVSELPAVLPEPTVALIVISRSTRHLNQLPQEYLPAFFAPPRA